ncbi:hypothetical protein HYS91_05100 [Candidatus Daviesbacteria bacterium]|nr:hypothetical protein [Candidatus Daviesbacteria bacterium]
MTLEASVGTPEAIDRLLARVPSGPEFTTSTIIYCDLSIAHASQRVISVISSQFPGQIPNLVAWREELINSSRRPHSSGFVIDNGGLYLRTPNGKHLPLNRVSEAVYHADPTLGAFEYIIDFYPTTNKHYAWERHPWFTGRIGKVVDIGGLAIDAPETKIMAVGYAAQIGKIKAVRASRTLLKRVNFFGGLGDEQRIPVFLETIGSMVGEVKTHQAYISKALTVMRRLAETYGFGEEDVRLLLDVAFIKNKGFDNPEEFRSALAPIIRLIGSRDLAEAHLHRDFLLRFFSASFPEWRRREFEEYTGQKSFETFKDLVKAIAAKRIHLTVEEVPQHYRELFGPLLSRRVERAERIRNVEVLEESVLLSNIVVKELDKETHILHLKAQIDTDLQSRIPLEPLSNEFGKLVDILTKENFDEEEKLEAFREVLRTAGSKMPERELVDLFDTLFDMYEYEWKKFFTSRDREGDRGPMEIVFGGRNVRIIEVEMSSRKQIYWSPTTHPVEVRTKEGLEFRNKAPHNFAQLVLEIIAYASTAKSTSKLGISELLSIFDRAYVGFKIRRPRADFSLTEYLEALYSTLNGEKEGSKVFPNFIKELEKREPSRGERN